MNPDLNSDDLLQRQANWLSGYRPRLRVKEQGVVVSVGDGIAWISGLPRAAIDDIIVFEDGSHAMVFDLTSNRVGAVLLHQTANLTSGAKAYLTGKLLGVPVGDALLGRVVDPQGVPLDDIDMPSHMPCQPLEVKSPEITARDFVQQPIYTGIKIIDTLIPIGKGQRQLLISDEGLGRSAIAIDTVINQKDRGVRCVYVLIGQKRSKVVSTIDTLREYGALNYTTVVTAEASALPGLQYLAPFAGCAIAEYWMQQGHDTLVIYDDLSAHAKTHRELSLLLRRPPGREAFPGDIFSVHARLLERATCLNARHGGGSMTALPIVETNQGEIAAYIPTNLISITDGQIYLDHGLYVSGFRPAIDIARSVSRIGGAAQHHHITEETARMKLDYLQFLELEVFTRFGARLEESMEAAIKRGRVLRELLKQERLMPLPETVQLAWLIAYNDGHFAEVSPAEVGGLFDTLAEQTLHSVLTLDSSREEWSKFVANCLCDQVAGEVS